MKKNIAFLELKYGNIYGGYPNFYAISEIALLVFEQDTNRIFLESWINNANIDVVNVFAIIDELGHTTGRDKEVVNLKTKKLKTFDEEYRLEEEDLVEAFKTLRPSKNYIKNFLLKNLKKYNFEDLIIFDGRRDIFLCERAGVNFDRYNIIDIQKILNKETEYLFSLNKLSVVINFNHEQSYLKSNNLQYWLHPIADKQIVPKTAAYDAARLMMIYNEFKQFKDDFMMKGALLLNKIQNAK
ncbi:MAG: hypothetical protein ACO388_01020 [Saprospiraceae bacterium]